MNTHVRSSVYKSTLDRRHSKFTIDKRGSKIASNSVFDCHLLPDWQQTAIKNSVTIFDLCFWIVLTFLNYIHSFSNFRPWAFFRILETIFSAK